MTKPIKQPKSWRDAIPVHPAADLFPLMAPDDLKALGDDIKEHGLQTNIAVWRTDDGRRWFLLDGRNRLDAAELVGLPVKFTKRAGVVVVSIGITHNEELNRNAVDDLTGTDPYAYVISANVHRRHLTAAQKREIIAAVLKAQPEKSNREIARQVKDDHHKVGAVRRELEATGKLPPVEKTTGKDGKARKMPERKPIKKTPDVVLDIAAFLDDLSEYDGAVEQILDAIAKLTVEQFLQLKAALKRKWPRALGDELREPVP